MHGRALALERALVPADRVRRTILSAALRVPGLSSWLVQRDRRVTVLAVGHALFAFLLAATFPMLLFVLGPVLLGVAHVAADVRYLVLRRELPAWWKHVVWIACVSLIAFRVYQETGVHSLAIARTEHVFVGGWMLLALVAGAVQARSPRRALYALPVWAFLVYFAWVEPGWTRLVFVHLHNLVAVVLWIWLFKRSRSAAVIPLVAILGGAAVLFFAHPWRLAESTGGISAFGLHLAVAAEWVAPGFEWNYAYGLLFSYVFLQSVHYSAWLLLIPQEDTVREAPTPFRSSARSLLVDFRVIGVVVVSLAALAVVGGALFDAMRARNVYLSLSMFHGYLELTIAAYFFAWGRFPRASTRKGSAPVAQ